MATVMIRRERYLVVKPDKCEQMLALMVKNHMNDRIPRGLDASGQPAVGRHAGSLYEQQLRAIGMAGKPPGVLTGGMARSVIFAGTAQRGDVRLLRWRADMKSSKPVRRPPWWIFHKDKSPEAREKALQGWRSGKRGRSSRVRTDDGGTWSKVWAERRKGGWVQGRKSQAQLDRRTHRQTMRWFMGGWAQRPNRAALGITDPARRSILKALQQSRIFQFAAFAR